MYNLKCMCIPTKFRIASTSSCVCVGLLATIKPAVPIKVMWTLVGKIKVINKQRCDKYSRRQTTSETAAITDSYSENKNTDMI